jgi:GntR family transcriptional repressor for pyruvate dehydrogenase complex
MAPSNDEGALILQPMSRDSLAVRVADAVKAYIVAESLEPGNQIPSERQLSEAFAVSRNIVREGLSALVAEGIIIKRPGRGVFLRQFDKSTMALDGKRALEEQQERYNAVREARAAVELGAIGLIISRITGTELRQLEDISKALERKVERDEPFFKDDMNFHLTLLRATRNEFLLQWTPLVEEVMRTWSYQEDALRGIIKTYPKAEGRRVAAEHRAILEAVQARDIDNARMRLKKHLQIAIL